VLLIYSKSNHQRKPKWKWRFEKNIEIIRMSNIFPDVEENPICIFVSFFSRMLSYLYWYSSNFLFIILERRWRPIPFELHIKRRSRLLVRGSVFYKSLIPSGFISLQISTLMKSFYRILTLQFVAARFGTFRNLYHEMNNLTARWLPCVEKGNIKFAYESYPN
jgi:hypothetical protein